MIAAEIGGVSNAPKITALRIAAVRIRRFSCRAWCSVILSLSLSPFGDRSRIAVFSLFLCFFPFFCVSLSNLYKAVFGPFLPCLAGWQYRGALLPLYMCAGAVSVALSYGLPVLGCRGVCQCFTLSGAGRVCLSICRAVSVSVSLAARFLIRESSYKCSNSLFVQVFRTSVRK